MKIKSLLLGAISFLIVGSFAAVGDGMALENTPPGVGVGLSVDGYNTQIPGKLAFLETDPIKIVLSLENVSASDIITSQGFSGRPFHLFLVFMDPDGKGVQADELGDAQHLDTHVPPPWVIPSGVDLLQVEPVAILPGTATGSPFQLSVSFPDAHTFYSFSKAGVYSVKALIPMRTYPAIDCTVSLVDYAKIDSKNYQGSLVSNTEHFSIIADHDSDGYFYPDDADGSPDCDDNNPAIHPGSSEIEGDGRDNDCNPATPDVAPVAKGTIRVQAEKYTVGAGSYPSTIKDSLSGMPVKVMDTSPTSCVSQKGFLWPNYPSIFWGCPPVEFGFGKTDGSGNIAFNVPPGEYSILGMYDPDPKVKNDELYISGTVSVLQPDTTITVNARSIINPAGKFVPARSTRRTGSELFIIEPEYIEWTGAQEFYPFVFESAGEWGVATSIKPPEGFVADYDSLSTDVASDLKAIQFIVTDVGSEWKDTKVEHRIKHRHRIENLKGKIGVKNSIKSKEKGKK